MVLNQVNIESLVMYLCASPAKIDIIFIELLANREKSDWQSMHAELQLQMPFLCYNGREWQLQMALVKDIPLRGGKSLALVVSFGY